MRSTSAFDALGAPLDVVVDVLGARGGDVSEPHAEMLRAARAGAAYRKLSRFAPGCSITSGRLVGEPLLAADATLGHRVADLCCDGSERRGQVCPVKGGAVQGDHFAPLARAAFALELECLGPRPRLERLMVGGA